MLYKLTPAISASAWIGFQVLAGVGIGIGLPMPLLAIARTSDLELASTGASLVIFTQTLGGAISGSICQTIFISRLVSGLKQSFPMENSSTILATGAFGLENSFDSKDLGAVRLSYNNALTSTYIAATVLAGLSLFANLDVILEWMVLIFCSLGLSSNRTPHRDGEVV